MSRQPSFFDFVCSNADKFALLFVMEVVAGLLSVVILFTTAPGTAGRVVSVFNVLGVVVIGGFTAGLLWKCHQR